MTRKTAAEKVKGGRTVRGGREAGAARSARMAALEEVAAMARAVAIDWATCGMVQAGNGVALGHALDRLDRCRASRAGGATP